MERKKQNGYFLQTDLKKKKAKATDKNTPSAKGGK